MESSSSPLLSSEVELLLLLLIACLGAVTLKKFKIPYTVGLVVIGLGLGFLSPLVFAADPLGSLTLSPDIILFIFIPPLIFESSIALDNQLLFKTLTPALMLAGLGLLVSAAIVGGLVAWLTPLSFSGALVFGALISATDPVAVIALFKELGVPKRLTMLVEGESMLNDATAIVLFDLVMSAIASGKVGVLTVGEASVDFLVVMLGGILVGVVIAAIIFGYSITQAKHNALIQTTVTIVIAYAAFIFAQRYLKVSGVIAVMSAGLVVGWYLTHRLKPEVRIYLQEFWDYGAFIANSLIFLLVGLTTSSFITRLGTESSTFWFSIGWAIIVVLIARAVAVFGLTPLSNLLQRSEPINWRYQLVTFWGGLRGAVALALALSLDRDFPNRDLIIAMTLGVALFTILIGGTTTGKLISWLKIDEPPMLERLGKAQATILAKREALKLLQKLESMRLFNNEIITEIERDYQQVLDEAETTVSKIWEELKLDPGMARKILWLQVLRIEHQAHIELYDRGLLLENAMHKLELMVDAKRDSVLDGQIPPRMPALWSLETPLEKLIFKQLKHFFGNRKFFGKRHGQLAAVRYEYDAVTAYVSQKIVKQVKQLVAAHAVEEAVARDCISFYQQASKGAFRRVEAMGTSREELASALQKQVATHAARISEGEVIEQLVADGVIPEKALDRIQDLIERENRYL
ncbi:Na+/H+ antiporter [Myxosarcina sp. GI1]|uniref:Na+/H+ antiporter n=1 Tax=Myxosarcina sp. GI1 TaxID=1541065 RepID=UPI000567CE7C|nr:Na+/H+ antiporter [Myxosarcina sp. GI1]